MVYVKAACEVGGRPRRVQSMKASVTARVGVAGIHETCLYGSGDIIVKGRSYPAWLYAQLLGQIHVTITKIAPGIEICYGGIHHAIVQGVQTAKYLVVVHAGSSTVLTLVFLGAAFCEKIWAGLVVAIDAANREGILEAEGRHRCVEGRVGDA